jgi:outer membrane lipoprotein carrier protein
MFLVPAPPAKATDSYKLNDNIEKILSAIEKQYGKKSFETLFNQTSTLAALDMTETANGKAIFSHPGKMQWEYLKPEKHQIVTNGKVLWIYRPEQGQVLVGDAREFFKTGAGGAFLSDIRLIRGNYIITLMESMDDHTDLELRPQIHDPNISKIIIRVSLKTNYIIQAIIYNTQGDTNFFEFTDIKFRPVEDSLFDFAVPEGVNIVNMQEAENR